MFRIINNGRPSVPQTTSSPARVISVDGLYTSWTNSVAVTQVSPLITIAQQNVQLTDPKKMHLAVTLLSKTRSNLTDNFIILKKCIFTFCKDTFCGYITLLLHVLVLLIRGLCLIWFQQLGYAP